MVSNTKHTPGPWRLDGAVIRGFTRAGHVHERPICELYRELVSSPETLANADLLLAAPDLLEALAKAQTLLNHMGDILNGCDMVDDEDVKLSTPIFEAVRAAIAKATSQPS